MKSFAKIIALFLLAFVVSFLGSSLWLRYEKPAPRVMVPMEMPKVEATAEIPPVAAEGTEAAAPVGSIEELIERESGGRHDGDEVYSLYEEDLPEDVIEGPKPRVSPAGAGPDSDDDKRPLIAIVVDDMGISHARTRDISSLHYPLTSSFLTYGTDLASQVAEAEAAGHEIIVHIPMEAKGKADAAPDVLTAAMSREELQAGLGAMLDKFPGVVGGNNHMGSKLTENRKAMAAVMEVLKARGMFFLDSKTSAKSVAEAEAKKAKVPAVSRQVFLDNSNDFDYITKQLAVAERSARKHGMAVAIGHPKSETFRALSAWLPTLEGKGLRLVPLSEIVKRKNS